MNGYNRHPFAFMKILAISDEVVPWIYSQTLLERCRDVDLVISCGDLPIGYLDFVVSTLNKPCFYVRGNHDHFEVNDRDGTEKRAPDGWTDLDMRVERIGNVRLAGLEGCLKYRPHAEGQYSQHAQWLRAWRLATRMIFGPPQIFVAHAPPFGIHNGDDLAHTGFQTFNWIIQTFKPRLFLHGHQHRNYNASQTGETVVDGTLVVNVHPYRLLEI
jgi:Icc-related predicted phosphoesterase